MRILLLLLIPISLFSQASNGDTGDCGAFHFRVTSYTNFGTDTSMYIHRQNQCTEIQDLVIDFYFWVVPDKIRVYDDSDSLIMQTDFVGSWFYQPCTQGTILQGYVEYHNSDLIMSNGFPPLNFYQWQVPPNQPQLSPDRVGLGRVIITTDSPKVRISWIPSQCGTTYTDMFIRCSEYNQRTYYNETFVDYVCDEADVYRDTIYGECGYDIFETIDASENGHMDTICGLYGQSFNYDEMSFRITQDETHFIDVTNDHGCTRTDTLVIDMVNLYVPNVCTPQRPYYLNPKIDFDIYDRWGNHIYKGNEWTPSDVESGVYVVVAEFKGKLFSSDVTVIE